MQSNPTEDFQVQVLTRLDKLDADIKGFWVATQDRAKIVQTGTRLDRLPGFLPGCVIENVRMLYQ